MKMKYLIIVSLILAILTIGAACATDEVAVDDETAASDITQDPIEEVENDEVIASDPPTEEDFYVEVEERVAVNSSDNIVRVSYYQETEGNLTVYVDESETPAYNQVFEYNACLDLNDLGITSEGIHKILANFVPNSGDPIKIIDTSINVTEKEGLDGFDVSIYNVYRNGFESSEDPLVFYYIRNFEGLQGNILIYADNQLYYNASIMDEDEIYVSELDKKLTFGKRYVQVKYFDGENTTLLKSKTVKLDYGMYITRFIDGDDVLYLDEEPKLEISLPNDATGDLYVIINGNELKVDYKDGKGEFTVPAEYMKLGESIGISVELRNDEIYPLKTAIYDVEIDFSVDCPDEMSVGEEKFLSVTLPSKYSGVLKVYTTKEDPEDDESYIKDAEYASANIANGKASISLSKLLKGDHNLMLEITIGDDVYSRNVWVDVKENSNKVTVTVEPATIEVGNSVTVKIKGTEDINQYFWISVDDGEEMSVKISNGAEKTLTVPFTTIGNHKIKVYASDEDYGEEESYPVFFSKTFTVTVKAKETPKDSSASTSTPTKIATKITAKKATFKAKKKVKKYTITLKAGKKAVKKVKVTLKVGKKTYKATTNAKGKATFKITKLTKKGKYTAVIKFAGKGNYLKTSKKVKITVK